MSSTSKADSVWFTTKGQIDAFAAALAREKRAERVTGDPEFKALEKEIQVVWLK